MSPSLRRAVQRASATLAVFGGVWSLWLVVFDGFSITIAGLVIRSHAPLNPSLLSAVSIAVFLLAGGRTTAIEWIARARPHASTLWHRLRERWRTGVVQHVLATALCLFMLIFGIVNASTAAGGSDSFGYVSQADLWLTGHPVLEQPWVGEVPWPNAVWSFAPLGYTPSRPVRFRIAGYAPEQDRWAIVPTYSPGLPMLMAIGKATAGACGPFVVAPIGGALLIAATYLLGLRLGSSTLGLLAAVLVASSPPFLLMHVVNMTDVPVAAAFAIACWCVLGTTMPSAGGAGLALGIALLIRPNLVPIVPVFLLWFAWRIRCEPSRRWHHVRRAAIVLCGAGAASLATSLIYWTMYGTPFESGYGPTAIYFSLANILPNARNYSQWFIEAQTPIGFLGLIALALPLEAIWPEVRDRSAIAMFALMTVLVIAEFFYYLVLDNSSYLRFFLVVYPFVMLGVATVAIRLWRVHRLAGPIIAAALVGFLVVNGVWVSRYWGVFNQALLEAKFADTADHVRRITPENSVVLAMQHSGSLRYYAGRVTLRWDILQEDWLDRAVEWMAAHGVRTYALLDDFELEAVVKRFKGQKLVDVLKGPPVFRFGNKAFFDFGLPAGTRIETVEIPVVDIAPKCWSAAPQPSIVWKK